MDESRKDTKREREREGQKKGRKETKGKDERERQKKDNKLKKKASKELMNDRKNE